jgi:hypothetical protein
MENLKHKIIVFWLTHIFLRRIGKRYPEFFKQWIYDQIDNRIERKIMLLRYTGESQMKFYAIALELNTDERNVYLYHKKAINHIISGI